MREKYYSQLEIYDRLRASEQAARVVTFHQMVFYSSLADTLHPHLLAFTRFGSGVVNISLRTLSSLSSLRPTLRECLFHLIVIYFTISIWV